MARWLQDGLTDLAVTYAPASRPTQRIWELSPDRLILVSTRRAAQMRFDPGYVFVEAGERFGREHAAAYADANAARISFGTAALGLEHLLAHGGSAYLPERVARPYLEQGRLFPIAGAPEFTRPVFLVCNKTALAVWPWFDAALAELQSGPGRIGL